MIELAAAMTSWTACGASDGAVTVPSGLSLALVTGPVLTIALATSWRRSRA